MPLDEDSSHRPTKMSGFPIIDDHIKDFHCHYRDIRFSKDTLVNIKKDLPVPQIDFLLSPKSEKPLKHPSLSHQIKVLKLMTINFLRFKISHL